MPPEQLLTTALHSQTPYQAAYHLAIELRDAGMSQASLAKLYNDRVALCRQPEHEQAYHALADCLDYITGYCQPDKKLYPEIVVVDK